MSTNNFDPRKFCPRCGAYPARVWKNSGVPRAVRWGIAGLALGAILLVWLAARSGSGLGAIQPAVPVLLVLLGLGCFFGLRIAARVLQARADGMPGWLQDTEQPACILLECGQCGHRWQKTLLEWDGALQDELTATARRPLDSTGEKPIEPIPYRPPNPRHGIWIVLGAMVLMLLSSLAVYGVFAAPRIGLPNGLIYSAGAVVFFLLIGAGLVFLPRQRATRLALLVITLALVIAALWIWIQ